LFFITSMWHSYETIAASLKDVKADL
jgi:hypothetical protein